MTMEKNLHGCLLETSLSVIIAMHLFPTRSDSIIIKLSKFAIKPQMNKEHVHLPSSAPILDLRHLQLILFHLLHLQLILFHLFDFQLILFQLLLHLEILFHLRLWLYCKKNCHICRCSSPSSAINTYSFHGSFLANRWDKLFSLAPTCTTLANKKKTNLSKGIPSNVKKVQDKGEKK